MLTAGGSQGKLVSERRRPGSARSAFQAAQAASTTASWPPASTRWLSQRSRRYSHTRSTGFNSGLYGGGWMRVRFAGTVRSSLTCQPAPSRTSAAWVPAGTARDSSARKTCMAAVETSGSTRATPPAALGADRAEQVGGAEALLPHAARAHALLVPDVGHAALLADAGLVHEPELDPPGLGVPVRHAPDQVRQLFLKPSCAFGSASGWTGRAFCHERSSPLSSRLIPASL